MQGNEKTLIEYERKAESALLRKLPAGLRVFGMPPGASKETCWERVRARFAILGLP
jgi:hypothetical protein